MILAYQNNMPNRDPKTFIAEGAVVIGKVTLHEYSSIWFNAVVRGDVNHIEIGAYTNIQDNSVVHVGQDFPTVIGDYVTVGHKACIHGCTIEDHVLIGMNATVLNGAVIGKGSIIAAGALVKEGAIIPPYSLVVGVPGQIKKTLPEDVSHMHDSALHYQKLWAEDYGYLK